MAGIQTLAEKLAEDTLKVMDATGDDRLFYEVAKVLVASSQTMEEAFVTEVRARLSERQARDFLKERIAAHKAKLQADKPAD